MSEPSMEMPPSMSVEVAETVPAGVGAEAIAPPTSPGMLSAPERESAWPTAVGIMMIVLSAGGALGSLWSFAWLVLGLGAGDTEAGRIWPRMMQALAFGGFVLWMVWLTAAICLLLRKPWTRRVLLACAAAKLILGGVEFTTTYASVPDLWTTVFGGVWLLIASALPVFTLIWFTRRGVRAAVESWRARAGAAAL
jgi:hypothetical protein